MTSLHKFFLRALFALAIVSISWIGSVARVHAQAEENTETARGVALGTGVRASAASTSALSLNVANLVITRLYHLEGTTSYEPAVGRFSFGSAVVDSASSRIAAGLSFRGLVGGGDDIYGGIDFRGGLALPISEALSLGVGLRYFNFSNAMGTVARGFTLDLAARATLAPNLHVAALATSIIDHETQLAPARVGGSMSYMIADTLTLGMDVMFNVTRNTPGAPFLIGGGLEWLSGAAIPVRVGYAYDELSRGHFVTGGLGYVDQRMGVDLSLRQQVSGETSNATYLLLSVRYFVEVPSLGAGVEGSGDGEL